MIPGETIELGPYTVRVGIRIDNPAWPAFLIFKGAVLIAKQFSMPCESDCSWHEARRGQYAKAEESKQDFRKYGRAFTVSRRGRPTNAERARRAALAPPEEEENSFA